MKTTQWDRVITSAPLNADAAKARDSKGTTWSPELKLTPGKVRSDVPLPMRPIPSHAPQIVGRKYGRFTVIGLYEKTASDRAAWVVRCVCGYYETRKIKALASGASTCCDECHYLTELKAGRVIRPTVAERTKVRTS